MKYCFGADVGGTTIKLGLFTVDGEILDKWEIITRTENDVKYRELKDPVEINNFMKKWKEQNE